MPVDAAGNCENRTVRKRGNLGSSFGGVTFKQSNLSDNRKAASHKLNAEESDINQATQQYNCDTSCTVLLDGRNVIFHCKNAHSVMANISIDSGRACRIHIHKRIDHNTCSTCGNSQNDVDEQRGILHTQALGDNCAEFSDNSSCLSVTSCHSVHSENNCPKYEQHRNECYIQPEDIANQDELCANHDSICVTRFIMGDDHCVTEREHSPSISTDSDNIDSGNLEGGSLLENCIDSVDRPKTYSEICNRINSYTENGCSRERSHVDNGIPLDSYDRCINSARNSMDSTFSMASDNVFFPNHSVVNSSSLSDVTSISSVSSYQSLTRDTITSRKRFELRHGNHQENEINDYLTPFQRKEKELKELRKERKLLLREQQEKEVEVAAMRACMDTMRTQVEEEKVKEMAEMTEKLRMSEKEKFEELEVLCRLQEDLSKMDAKYTDLKRKLSDKEEKFQEYLFDMYKKGQLAATFEREQELEMLASSQKARVSVRELTRKLSTTELELAKWQGLKLTESYSIAERPETQAEATLSFLKDSFFHFLTSKSDSEDHLRAMITIFNYSDPQMAKIRKGLEESKRIDRKRLSLK